MFSNVFRLWKSKLSLSKFLQMKLNNFLFRFLPFTILRFYISTLGRLYYLVNRQEKVLIQETITRVFRGKIDARNLQRKIKEAFKGIFDHYHEKLFVGYSNFPKLLEFFRTQVRFEGREKLEAALGSGKGVILVTGHFGAVELLPGTLTVNGFPTSMICRFQTTRLRETIGYRAESIGLNLIDADKGNSFLAAMKALKEGRILITECDEFEEWRPDPQRDTSFLSQKLDSDRTLEILQKRSGAPVVTALMQRDGQKQYTCGFTALGNGTPPVNMPISEQCLRILETAVETYPEQWYQWKKFGKIIKTNIEVENDRSECGYLAPEIGISVPDQA